jgi:hypothetical protein
MTASINNLVTIEAIVDEKASGVPYKLGGAGGSLTCFVKNSIVCCECNLFIVQRSKIRSTRLLPPGRSVIEVHTAYIEAHRGGPLQVNIGVNG